MKHSLEINGQRYYDRKFQPGWLMFAKVLMRCATEKSGLERESDNNLYRDCVEIR